MPFVLQIDISDTTVVQILLKEDVRSEREKPRIVSSCAHIGTVGGAATLDMSCNMCTILLT